ncbi:MAG: PAS domain S-box protein [Sediminibacterium sp.]
MLPPIQPDFKSIFEYAPGSNLILSPDLIIVAVSDAYLKATMTKRLDLIGYPLFKIFLDNPNGHNTTGVSNLRLSLNYVLEHRAAHRMDVQKYDIRRPDGTFEERYWQPLNTPVFNDQQELVYIIHNVEEVTQSKKEEEALKSSNFLLSEAQRIAKIGHWTYYMNGDLKWSDNMYLLYGLPSKIFTTTPAFFFELVHPNDREKMQQWMQACLADQAPGEFEFRSILPNGSIHYYNGTGEMKYDKQNTPLYLQGTVQDITERKEAEQKLIKANRLYFFISQINQMIVRTTDEETLFKEACRIAIDLGKFRMAWIGMIDEATKKVVPLMHAGEERGYLTQIKYISVDDIPEGRGPTGTALRQGKYTICNDIENDPQMAFWKEAALERGYLSSMALPIKKFGKVVGVFGFYSSEKNFFDAEEIALLEEATGDVAFALEFFDKEKQRRKAVADLEKTNERLLIAQEIAHNGYWEIDLINGQHYWSDELYKIFEIENTGTVIDVEAYMSLIHPDDLKVLSDGNIGLLEKNIPLNAEFRIIQKDGNIKYLLAKAKLIKSKDGLPMRIEGTTQDITERKKTELDLYLSENRSRKIFESGIIGLIYWDSNGEILDANDYFFEMTGYTKKDLKEKKISWSKMTPAEYAELDRIALEQIAKTGICKPVEKEYIRKDGTRLPVLLGATAFEGNNPEKGVAYVMDISERIKAEKEITQYKFALDQSAIVAITDRKGIIKHVNENFCKISKYSARELIGQDHRIINSGYHDKSFIKSLWVTIAQGKIWRGEICNKAKDGTIYWVDTTIVPLLDDHGKPMQYMAIRADITERKISEQKLEESENRYRRLFDTSPIAITEEDHTPFYEKIESLRASGISKNYATYFHNHREELYEMLGKVQIIGVNQGLLDLTGANNVEDFVANRSKFFVSMTEMTVFKLMDLIRDGGGYFEEETKIKSLSGEIRDVVVRLKYPAAPPYNSVAITMTDVTKQKQFEQKITESENRMRLATSSAGMGVWYWDIKNDHMVWDKRLYQIYDLSESQLGAVYGGWLSRLHPEDKDRVNEVMQTSMRDKQTQYGSEFRIIWGDGSVRYIKGTGISEYDDNGNVKRMMGINWDVTETKLAEEELKNNTQQLRQLTNHLQTIREEERKRIGREIHDELGQQLAAIKMDVVWIDNQIPGETTAIKDKLQNIVELLDGSHKSVRKILNELRPPVLDGNSLLEAIQWLGQQFAESTGKPVHFTSNQQNINFPPEYATCLFRVYQESLTNIMRHARASKVVSSLNILNNNIELAIADDGIGFDTGIAESKRRFGLLGMKERVFSLKGKFELVSSPGKGTRIVINIPY